MTIENDFLPFATANGANVLTQAQYAALAALATGYQSGVANSAQLNKTWRQSSIMAAVLAQFIVNSTGQPAIDDGTTATLLANLAAAVSANSEALIGSARNLSMYVATASATATLTADEIIVGSALGGLKYTVAGFNKTINLATTGAGGMDTGTAPVSGYVALYAIYNPATGGSALLATNATSAAAPNVYGGASLPVGYTASALVSVWPTNSSGQFIVAFQRDRHVSFAYTGVLTASTASFPSFTALSIGGAVPKNATAVSGELLAGSNTSSTIVLSVAASSTGIGQHAVQQNNATYIVGNYELDLAIPQTMYYTATASAGTLNMSISVSSYRF